MSNRGQKPGFSPIGNPKVCCTVREGHKRPKRGVPNVANTRDPQEQVPCATYRFLGRIQVPYEAPVLVVGGDLGPVAPHPPRCTSFEQR
eukprot:1184500-Prorocentrum_minimum.AAC.3